MKKTLSAFWLLLVAVVVLASCKKDQQDFNVVPKSSIIFDDNVDKIAADYQKAGNLNLKIGISGSATSVRVTSTYTVGADAKTKDLGTIPVANGVAVLNIPAINVRNAADGAVIGAGSSPSSTRPANTYTLIVDAINPDNSTERRYFTAVIVQ